ncbi:hypothetical protein [Enterococcus faecalis]|uniref:Uncharacterized protein n=1 Tax=Enterococcus faecalis RP2S-4 TaxID=1244145 RepID=A0ABC9TJX7_ENTFL|nr:hypothetical protein [Enterococcus faecalis]EPI08732.1 hypothetical protein D358_01507 [Enterococcus faecalis RP2S-4]
MKEALKKIILYPTYKEKQKRSIQRLKKDYEYYQKYTKEEIDFLFIEAETKLIHKKYTFPISYISLLSITFIAFYHLTRTFGRAIKNYGKATNYFESLTIEEYGHLILNMYTACFFIILLTTLTCGFHLISSYSTTQKEVSLLKMIQHKKE